MKDTKDIKTLADLTPDGDNFNRHTEFGQKLLEDSLRKFGAGRSILVDKDGNIIAGNSTTETAAAIGMEDVIVVPTDGKKLVVVQRTDLSLDSPEGREMALADNMTALKGIDIDLAKVQETLGDDLAKAWGMEIPEVQKQAQEDDFDPDKPVETVCKKGDIWKLGNHRLMCGDSTDAASVTLLMDGEKADLLLTDPPYGTTQLVWDVKLDLQKMWEQINASTKSNAASLLFGTQPFVTDLINANREMFRYDIIWKKTMRTGFFDAMKRPLRLHEIISVFYSSQPTYNPQMGEKEDIDKSKIGRRHFNSNVMKTNGGFVGKVGKEKAETYYYEETGLRYATDVIEFSNWNGAIFGNTENSVKHPTQKPLGLMVFLMASYSNKNNLILDLFGGSGTTLIAAEKLNRKCYMMELDPHYCDVIIARWEKLTGNKAERISNGNE